jgi:hypothetical protein
LLPSIPSVSNSPSCRTAFRYRVDLAPSDIREVATKRVLAKKTQAREPLKRLYSENQSYLNAALRLERTSRRTDITESDLIDFYPYPPHYIDLCIGIMSGVRLQPGAPRRYGGSNRTIIKQAYEPEVPRHLATSDRPWSSARSQVSGRFGSSQRMS